MYSCDETVNRLGAIVCRYFAPKDGPEWELARSFPEGLLKGSGCWDECLAAVLAFGVREEKDFPGNGAELIQAALRYRGTEEPWA